jgi:alpha-glucosidase
VLSLYKAALRVRLGIAGDLRWHDAPSPDVLAFERDGGFVCVVNVGDSHVQIGRPGDLILSSCDEGDLEQNSESVTLPPATATWWATRAR